MINPVSVKKIRQENSKSEKEGFPPRRHSPRKGSSKSVRKEIQLAKMKFKGKVEDELKTGNSCCAFKIHHSTTTKRHAHTNTYTNFAGLLPCGFSMLFKDLF